jgi:hypothetical protein
VAAEDAARGLSNAPARRAPYNPHVQCPKCGAVLPADAADCVHCGIVLAKYLERHSSVPQHYRHSPASSVEADTPASMSAAAGRGAFLLFLLLWTTTLAGGVSAERVNSSFIHLPNLVFHEAGHILFSPFGRFMTVLGGSLTQVLIPLLCAGVFLWQARDPFGAAVASWWAGENLIDVAPYINDARDLQLVLLGGRTGAEVEGHDWEYLLNAMGVAHRDHTIAAAVQAAGVLAMIAALVWGAAIVWAQIAVLRRSGSVGGL